MRANRRSDTAPEIAVRRLLHARGLRFRKDFPIPDVVGKPRADIVFLRDRVAVFVDGCYWHGCPEHFRMPSSNTEYWTAKIERNRARDQRVSAALREAGWRVVRVWEHESSSDAADSVRNALAESRATFSLRAKR